MSANTLIYTNIEPFKEWLVSHGVEILPLENANQILRFKGLWDGVLLRKGSSKCTYTKNAIRSFNNGLNWNQTFKQKTIRKEQKRSENKTKVKKKKKKAKRGTIIGKKNKNIKLLCRDGNKCFYCDKPLNDDITLEHLIPISKGGQDNLDNLVLAHDKCNQDVGSLPIYKKVQRAIQNRTVEDFSLISNY